MVKLSPTDNITLKSLVGYTGFDPLQHLLDVAACHLLRDPDMTIGDAVKMVKEMFDQRIGETQEVIEAQRAVLVFSPSEKIHENIRFLGARIRIFESNKATFVAMLKKCE